MAKYLFKARYDAEGVKGLLKEGGSGRRDAVANLAESLGGRLEALYFAFGDDDVYSIVDLPDHASAVALSLTVAASGAGGVSTTVLLTPEDLDAAARKSPQFRPPGG